LLLLPCLSPHLQPDPLASAISMRQGIKVTCPRPLRRVLRGMAAWHGCVAWLRGMVLAGHALPRAQQSALGSQPAARQAQRLAEALAKRPRP